MTYIRKMDFSALYFRICLTCNDITMIVCGCFVAFVINPRKYIRNLLRNWFKCSIFRLANRGYILLAFEPPATCISDLFMRKEYTVHSEHDISKTAKQISPIWKLVQAPINAEIWHHRQSQNSIVFQSFLEYV